MATFRILGPVEVWAGETRLELGGQHQVALLTCLLLAANRAVSNDALSDAVWGSDRSGGRHRLQMAISRVRRSLARVLDDGVAELQTVGGGYLLAVAPGELDSAVFESLVDDAGQLIQQESFRRAQKVLEDALALWRGQPLADVAFEDFARAEILRLEDLHLRAIKTRVEVKLALGEDGSLAHELEQLTWLTDPPDEKVAGQLMLALYRSGKQQQALDVYRQIQVHMATKYGLEPTPQLKGLESQILEHDPVLTRGSVGARESDPRLPLPRLLQAALSQRCIGRDHESAVLMSSWRSVEDGDRRALLLAGEAGIGKTRLAAHVAQELYAHGTTVMYGRCDEGIAIPYQPFVAALRPYVTSLPGDRLRDQLHGLAKMVGVLWPELSLPDRRIVGDEYERLALFDCTTALLETASRDRPLLLILDDLQWASTPTLNVLRHILRSDRQLRVLVLATYRTEELSTSGGLADLVSEFHRDASASHMAVRGVSQATTTALIKDAIRGLPTPRAREIGERLHAQAAGNPFFIRELIANLAEADASDTPDRSAPTHDRPLPDGILQVISRRVARLTPSGRATLRAAAVAASASTTVSAQLLIRTVHDELLVLDAVEEAVGAGLLTDLGRGQFVFAHALVQQATYQALGSARRMELHLRIAEALEATGAPASVEALAHHYAEAAPMGRAKKAAAYALEAARRALQRLGFEEAVLHCERGLGTLADASADAGRLQAELLITLGDARWALGEDVASAQRVCFEASELAQGLGDSRLYAEAALAFAGPLWLSSSEEAVRPTVKLLEHALAGLASVDDAEALRARVMARLSAALVEGADEERRRALASQALAAARHLGDGDTLARVIQMRHWIISGPDNAEEQLGLASELVDLAELASDPRLELEARAWRIDHYLELGDADAVGREREAIQRPETYPGDRRSQWIRLVVEARDAHMAGKLETFRVLAEQAFRHSVEGKDLSGSLIFRGQMMALSRQQGRVHDQLGSLEEGASRFPGMPVWRANLASAHADLGHEGDARRHFERLAVDGFAQIPRDRFWMSIMATLCEVAAYLGDATRAQLLRELLSPFAGRIVLIPGVVCQGAVSRFLGLLEMTIGRYDAAATFLSDALTLNRRVDAGLWVAYTKYNQAALLVQTGSHPGHESVISILDEVLLTADHLGLIALGRRAQELRARSLSLAAT